MYILAKIIPLLVLPLGLCCLMILIGLKKRYFYLLKIALLILWVFSIEPTAKFLWNVIEFPYEKLHPNTLSYADAIVVLSGGNVYKIKDN